MAVVQGPGADAAEVFVRAVLKTKIRRILTTLSPGFSPSRGYDCVDRAPSRFLAAASNLSWPVSTWKPAVRNGHGATAAMTASHGGSTSWRRRTRICWKRRRELEPDNAARETARRSLESELRDYGQNHAANLVETIREIVPSYVSPPQERVGDFVRQIAQVVGDREIGPGSYQLQAVGIATEIVAGVCGGREARSPRKLAKRRQRSGSDRARLPEAAGGGLLAGRRFWRLSGRQGGGLQGVPARRTVARRASSRHLPSGGWYFGAA